jgi:hypothetical protein
MKLPNHEKAFVPPEKLTAYLLSESHAVGRSKARFFRMHGFTDDNVALLEQGLINIAQENEIEEEEASPYGTKYLVRGILETPSGSFVSIQTVWIIEHGAEHPRFITAYPD